MSISEPDKITTPWASTGSKNPIPENANNTTGAAGFDKGFPDITMTPEEAGGLPPAGQDFNGILYQITDIIRYMQAGGQPTFSSDLSTAIGGYPKGSIILGSDGATLWQSKIDNNITNPNLDSSNWASIDVGLKGELAGTGGSGMVGFTQSGTGAVLRTAQGKMRECVTLQDFGSVGNMSSNDSAGAQKALNTNRPVTAISATGYKITSQLTSNADAKITGEGLSSALSFSGLPASVDAFKFSPPADGNAREYAGLSGVYILQSSGGRHTVLVDVSAAGQIVSRFKVDSSYLRANGAGNYAFVVHNPTNAADRFFLGYFENSVFDGGLLLNGAGDSINVIGNTFTGVNEAVVLVQTTEASPGASGPSSMFVFERNNSTADKGIHIIEAQSPKIRDNNLECGNGPGAGVEQALINIEGRTKGIFGAEVTGNAIMNAPNCTTGVFLGNTDRALVENNIFGVAATGYSIVVSPNSKNAMIGVNTFNPTGTGREIQDLGVGTKGVLKYPTLLNGWGTVVNLEPAGFIKSIDGLLRISGVIGNGIVTSGTTLFILPDGFRPDKRQFFSTYGLTSGGSYVTCVVRVDVDGSVRITNSSGGAASLVELGLCGISFTAKDVV